MLFFRFRKGEIKGWTDHDICRNYSISSRPGLDYYRITVKRETAAQPAKHADGVVSSYILDHVKPGDMLQVRAFLTIITS